MFGAFTAQVDSCPLSTARPAMDLNAKNPVRAPMAEVSPRLNLEIEDRADDLLFNEIIWKAVRGIDSPMPPPSSRGVRDAEVIRGRLGGCWGS